MGQADRRYQECDEERADHWGHHKGLTNSIFGSDQNALCGNGHDFVFVQREIDFCLIDVNPG
jgi:hypothetical protein